jgi:hypothetical protein
MLICTLGLDPPFQGFFRVSAKDQTLGGRILKKNDRVFANIGAANKNEKVFAQGSSLDPSRSSSSCIFGDSALKYLGETLTIKVSYLCMSPFEYVADHDFNRLLVRSFALSTLTRTSGVLLAILASSRSLLSAATRNTTLPILTVTKWSRPGRRRSLFNTMLDDMCFEHMLYLKPPLFLLNCDDSFVSN